ncbi:MAG: hypothetical protein OXG25_03360 [Gammaproteobacteria bacterium]|nr:hypothetical protein [Gammaproteobacteria bacterium]
MVNAIPIIGWAISFVLATLLAVPFWFVWSYLGIGEMFGFLPVALQTPGFWATVGIFMCLSIFRAVALPRGLHVGDKNGD